MDRATQALRPTAAGAIPAHEHDACGVGFVARLDGRPGHDLVRDAVRVLVNLEHRPLVRDGGLETDDRGNLSVDAQMMTSTPGVFAAGDCVHGASLVVRAIHDGRRAAECIDRYLRRDA